MSEVRPTAGDAGVVAADTGEQPLFVVGSKPCCTWARRWELVEPFHPDDAVAGSDPCHTFDARGRRRRSSVLRNRTRPPSMYQSNARIPRPHRRRCLLGFRSLTKESQASCYCCCGSCRGLAQMRLMVRRYSRRFLATTLPTKSPRARSSSLASGRLVLQKWLGSRFAHTSP